MAEVRAVGVGDLHVQIRQVALENRAQGFSLFVVEIQLDHTGTSVSVVASRPARLDPGKAEREHGGEVDSYLSSSGNARGAETPRQVVRGHPSEGRRPTQGDARRVRRAHPRVRSLFEERLRPAASDFDDRSSAPALATLGLCGSADKTMARTFLIEIRERKGEVRVRASDGEAGKASAEPAPQLKGTASKLDDALRRLELLGRPAGSSNSRPPPRRPGSPWPTPSPKTSPAVSPRRSAVVRLRVSTWSSTSAVLVVLSRCVSAADAAGGRLCGTISRCDR